MATDVEGASVDSVEARWPLERVLATIGGVLAGTVVIRAIGGLLSGLDVTSFHLNLGARSGAGLVVNQADFGVPYYIRLQYGTAWADVVSGLTLLAAVGLITLPRMVWDVPPNGRRSTLPSKLVIGVGVAALATAAVAVVGTVNWVWHAQRIAGPAEAINVAQGVATVVLAVLCTVLCWFAWPYLGESEPGEG